MKYILIYLIIINAVSFLIMLVDKIKAKKHRRRISEMVLLGIAAAGGALGTIVSMEIFRHKTKHLKFTIGVPMILAVQILIAVFTLMYIQK